MNRQEFERVSPESVGIRSGDIQRLLDRLEESHTRMHGLMIMRSGKVCAEGWWEPYAPGLRHGLQSLSKTWAATAAGIACTEGILSLDERVIDIFPREAPKRPDALLKKLRVRDVLCMGCGMDEMPHVDENWVRSFLSTPVRHEPGTAFMYNSLGSSLLGEMVRRRSGQGLQEYLTPRLFDRIGVDAGNLRWHRHPDGMEAGGGGLYATTEDNLRLMKLYLDGGIWNAERILSRSYVEQAVRAQNDSSTERYVNPPAKDNFVGYGFQIWMCRYPGAYRADGAMGQFSICVPDLDMVIAVNETAVGAEGVQITLDHIWDFLGRLDAKVKQLPANEKEESALLGRLRRLSVGRPAYTPYRGCLERFNGMMYRVLPGRGGKLPGFQTQIMHELFGGERSAGMEQLRFLFGREGVCLSFLQDGQWKELRAAVDGRRAENHLSIRGEVAELALASGCFPAEETFELSVLWPETCYSKTVRFRFEEEQLQIEIETFPLTTTVPGGTSSWMPPEQFTGVRCGG